MRRGRQQTGIERIAVRALQLIAPVVDCDFARRGGETDQLVTWLATEVAE